LTEILLVSVYRYATYVEVPDAKFAVKVPDSIPLEVACMLPCSGVTAYHAVSVIKPAVDNVTQNEGNNMKRLVQWCTKTRLATRGGQPGNCHHPKF